MPSNFSWSDKKIVITGAAGTVGQAQVKHILSKDVRKVVALDSNESGIYMLGEEYADDPRLQVAVGDVRSPSSVFNAFQDTNVVFHGAALKHVKLGEEFPDEIVATNIIGVQNVIKAALQNEVERLIFMSSDKAVNPTNVMGTSKLMGERLIAAANYLDPHSKTILASTRFGNVLGSRGSVLPTFMQQIRSGNPITLTSPEMSRFVMTSEEAVSLVTRSAEIAQGGEVFVTKMPIMRIIDVAEALKRLYAPKCGRDPETVEINIVGKRPGEKLYEELLSEDERSRAAELDDFFVVQPALHNNLSFENYGSQAKAVEQDYRSDHEEPMTVKEIMDYFEQRQLLECDLS
jgi:FlaA1/EpsC-like NDP-sugar epimerase